MKKILLPIGIGLLLCLNTVQGQWSYITTNVATIASQAPTNKVLHLADGTTSSNKVLLISEVSVYGTGASGPATVRLYDWGGGKSATNAWNSSLAITNYFTNTVATVTASRYSTNLTNTYITTTGGTNEYVTPGIYTLYTTNGIGALKTSAAKLLEVYLPESATGETVVYENLDLITSYGLLAQVTSNCTVRIKYRQMFSPSNP